MKETSFTKKIILIQALRSLNLTNFSTDKYSQSNYDTLLRKFKSDKFHYNYIKNKKTIDDRCDLIGDVIEPLGIKNAFDMQNIIIGFMTQNPHAGFKIPNLEKELN